MKKFFDLNVAVKVDGQEAFIFKHKEKGFFLTLVELKKCKVNEVDPFRIAYKRTPYHVKFEEISYQHLNSKAFCVVKKELDAAEYIRAEV